MVKTIRVSDETHAVLKKIREVEGIGTYEQVIRCLIVRSRSFSGFGRDPDLPGWTEEEDRARFR